MTLPTIERVSGVRLVHQNGSGMSRTSPIWTAYQNLLRSGRLQQNAEQAALATQLGQLQHKLTHGRRWSRLKQNDSESGIYIYGGVGTGKSRIADLFAATLPAEVTRRRTHFFEFMTDVHQRLHVARSRASFEGDPLVEIGSQIQSESCVLCLDEFQVSDIADAMILKRLFGSFWDRGGIMVSTSNRHPTELYKNGLNRALFVPFIQELQQRCVIFEMKGRHDYRMHGKQQLGRPDVFFLEKEDFHRSLTEALHGSRLQPVSIPVVMQRSIMVDAASPKSNSATSSRLVVSSTFAELCEAFVGAADYHALCHTSSTIYVSGLRKFRSDELDVVRRFITLIDVAYEARTQVFCLSTDTILNTFENILLQGGDLTHNDDKSTAPQAEAFAKMRAALKDQKLTVKGEGGSSSSMMSTFINDVEWSATGLQKVSLATGGAGETDVRFAITRAISRLSEMSSEGYGAVD
jgi:peroxisome-assembly ATPase